MIRRVIAASPNDTDTWFTPHRSRWSSLPDGVQGRTASPAGNFIRLLGVLGRSSPATSAATSSPPPRRIETENLTTWQSNEAGSKRVSGSILLSLNNKV